MPKNTKYPWMKLSLTLILTIVSSTLFAQTIERPINSIYGNLFSDASIISLTYDRQYLISPTFILSSKVGLGYNQEAFNLICINGCSKEDKYTTIPHHFTANVGKGSNFFEFGLGGTVILGNINQHYLLYPTLGYRVLPLKSKDLNARLTFQYPLSGFPVNDLLFSLVGISLGVSI